jgi:hypothetical protein
MRRTKNSWFKRSASPRSRHLQNHATRGYLTTLGMERLEDRRLLTVVDLTTVMSNLNLETYSQLPTAYDQLHLATGWQKLSQASTDYLHFGSYIGEVEDGQPIPPPDGSEGIMGLLIQNPPNTTWYEYGVYELESPLVPGVTYTFDLFAGTTKATASFPGEFEGDLVVYGLRNFQTFSGTTPIEDFASGNYVELLSIPVDQPAEMWTYHPNRTITPTEGFEAIVFGIRSEQAITYLVVDAASSAPRVTDVRLSGSTWPSIPGREPISFRDDSFFGEPLTGSGSQLKPIPTQGINTIDIEFSESVVIDQDDLMLLTEGGGPEINGFDPDPDNDPATHVVRWTLDGELTAGKYSLLLNHEGTIVDLFGIELDGDWDNPDSPTDTESDTFWNGDGLPGGEFRFNFSVLPGDYNRYLETPSQIFRADTADYSVWRDLLGTFELVADGNGSGQVDALDWNVWKAHFGDTVSVVTPGDYTRNGEVDGEDYDFWKAHFGDTSGPGMAADGNLDGVVDAADFTVYKDNEGRIDPWIFTPPATGSASLAVSLVGAPQVTGISVSGSASTHAEFDFAAVVGSGEQLRTVPLGGLDTISIRFSEEVFVESGDLVLTGMQGQSIPAVAQFDYDVAACTATWRFAGPLSHGQYLIRLSEAVHDIDSDALDGEFTNPWTLAEAAGIASTFPSGDGEAGGEFRFRFTNLPGDYNRNNIADAADYTVYADNTWRNSGAQQYQGDGNGDGDVGTPDHGVWSSSFGTDYSIWKTYEPGLIQVSTLADENDGNYSAGDLSLREALHLAKITSGDETIVFAPGLTGSIITINEFSIGAEFDGNVTIDGPGADVLTIDSYSGYTIFNIAWNSGLDGLTVRGLTMKNSVGVINSTNGADVVVERLDIVDTPGTAFYIYGGGDLTISETEFSGNSTGYGVDFSGGGQLTIADSSFIENNMVSVVVRNSTAHISNTTFSGNYTSDEAGALAVYDADVMLVNVTITENEGSYTGGIYVVEGANVTLHNSIVAGNVGSDIYSPNYLPGTFNSASSHNLIGIDGTTYNPTFPTGNGNELGVTANDLQLAPLDYYGGRTRSHMLKAGSVAIDAGDDSLALDAAGMPLAFDQRGLTRITGGAVDVGTVEGTSGSVYTVTTLADDNDGDHSHGNFSLREVLATAALTLGDDTIEFAPSLTSGGAATITLTYDGPDSGTAADQLTIGSNVTIDGPAANLLTISGNSQTRVFQVNSGVTATIRDLRITGGNSNTSGYGGGIYSSGTLIVDRSQIEGNFASSSGGGIYVQAGTLALTNSTVANNLVMYQGGGIYIGSTSSPALISNSTISTNTATYGGAGGIYDGSSGAVIVNSTITANATSYGAAAGIQGSATKLFNTIVAGNGGNKDLAGTFHATSAYNLIGYDGNLTNGIDHGVNGNLVGGQSGGAAINALLSTLGYYGGTTKTHRLLSGSAAIDAGDNAVALAYLLDDDQRGEDRIVDWLEDDLEATVDIGAVELAFDEIHS